MDLNNIKKPLQVIFLLVMTLYLCHENIQSMRANTWYFNAYNIVQDMQDMQDSIALEKAKLASERAVTIEPTHPHYLHFAAYIDLLLLNNINDPTKKMLLLDSASSLLLRSLSHREAWAETWVLLASVTIIKEGASDEVYDYLNQAYLVAPYNYTVRSESIKIMLANWKLLSPKFKSLYLKDIAFMYKNFFHKFHNLLYLAKEVDALPTLCLTLRLDRNYKKFTQTFKFKKNCNML